ncbi:alpha/beta fold hydrolase [Ornithinimicrobium sp. W1679]|uniref:alpha/beta fold hydrolase n=1 Tax=Ornithinimicrobium sp. W1679 TaxID=3418770 RepID=UPI003CE87B1A
MTARPDQARPDDTRRDETRTDQTRSDRTRTDQERTDRTRTGPARPSSRAAGSTRTRLVPGLDGDVEVLTTGRGRPHTVLAHGAGGSIATTRPYAGRVAGMRTFVHQRGHGRSHRPAGTTWGYGDLAGDLWAVADVVEADRALGISMGAGALLAGLAQDPDRFQRVVLVLPAVLDRVREDAATVRLGRFADLLDAGDAQAVAAHLLADQPATVRHDPAVVRWAHDRAEELAGSGVADVLRVLVDRTPLTDPRLLQQVRCPVLVLGQEDDPLHPASVAREVASLLPRSVLHVAGPGGIMWEHRERTRDLVGEFLSAH